MSQGEAVLLNEVLKFGHPWHGLYSNATGYVTPPAGPAFAIPGIAPSGTDFNPPGFCAKLAKPGVAAATNDANDVAAGRTWLNYALLSGGYQRLYGKNMGGPIYIASDGSAWHVDVNRNPTSTSGVNRLEIILNLTNFGEISDPAATVVTQATTMVSATFDAGGDIAGAGVLSIIEDINETGSKFLMSVFETVSTTPFPFRRVLGLFEVSITGIPPSATASITKLADFVGSSSQATSVSQTWKIAYMDGTWSPQYIVQSSYNAPGWVAINNWRSWPTAQNDYTEHTLLIGARYVAGVAQIMTLHRKENYTGTGDVSISGVDVTGGDCLWTFTKSSTFTVTAEIRANGAAVLSQSMSVTASGTASISYKSGLAPVTSSSSSTIFNFGSGSTTLSGVESWRYGSQAGADSYGPLGPNAGPNGEAIFGAWRYSNSVYGLIHREYLLPGATITNNVVFRGVVGAVGSESTVYSPTLFSGGAKYASEHPVTGAIARGASPVCWV